LVDEPIAIGLKTYVEMHGSKTYLAAVKSAAEQVMSPSLMVAYVFIKTLHIIISAEI
jgi:hypothetical protein